MTALITVISFVSFFVSEMEILKWRWTGKTRNGRRHSCEVTGNLDEEIRGLDNSFSFFQYCKPLRFDDILLITGAQLEWNHWRPSLQLQQPGTENSEDFPQTAAANTIRIASKLQQPGKIACIRVPDTCLLRYPALPPCAPAGREEYLFDQLLPETTDMTSVLLMGWGRGSLRAGAYFDVLFSTLNTSCLSLSYACTHTPTHTHTHRMRLLHSRTSWRPNYRRKN